MIKEIKRIRVINSLFNEFQLEDYLNNPTWKLRNRSILSIYELDHVCYFYIDRFNLVIKNMYIYEFPKQEIVDLITERFNLVYYEIRIVDIYD